VKVTFRGLKLLGFVAATYAILALFWPHRTLLALTEGAEIFGQLLMVFPLIILLTALINHRFDAKSFAAHLGEDSGVRGWLLALGAGILSHGPMYAWYPMFEEIKSHGVKYGLIAAFFYARSIKVPMLPIMVDYFGLAFTVILTVYILIAAWLQGLLIEWLCRDCND
jgi:uncharacterized membrane protein YraQ (UPF0718 family)